LANTILVMTVLQMGWSRWWLFPASIALVLIAGAIGVSATQSEIRHRVRASLNEG
jgi:hypothetical protein